MKMLINSKFVNSKKKFKVINPYNNQVIDTVPIATKQQINQALSLSYHSKPNLTPQQRASILLNSAKELKRKKSKFAKLISSESGLCLKDTTREVKRSLNVLTEAANVALSVEKDITKKYIIKKETAAKLKVITEPLNLVVGITPFNHPLNQVAHKVCPAIAAGTPIVLKPSEKTPLTALEFGNILLNNGLPKNMLNILTGYPPKNIVDTIITNPLVEMISFTGGTAAGNYIAKTLVKIKPNAKYVLELGGNSACTILEDADLNLAAKTCLYGAFSNSGQRCTAIKRILLHNKIADEFIDKFMKLTEKIKYGNPLSTKTDMGTVINSQSAKNIKTRVDKSIKLGAKLLYGNKIKGALYSPTVLDKVNPKNELVVKETFGPVAPIIRIKNINHAIKIINSVDYKLAGSAITSSKAKAEKIASETAVGQFNWNSYPGYRTECAPFGGFGCSGNYEKEGIILAAQGMRRIRTFYTH